MSKWTKTEDEMPEEDIPCLVAYRFGFSVANLVDEDWWDYHGRIPYEVTHWMPIEEPDET
jgi:hypothetical protein